MAAQTVRDATFDVWREYGLTSIFANPGSTEIKLLADLPDDLRFVLGAARGLGRRHGDRLGDRARRAGARDPAHDGRARERGRRARDRARQPRAARRRSSASRTGAISPPSRSSPGKLHGLAGEYPVWVDEPVRPQDVPGAIARACHEAVTGRGPGARDRADGRLARRGRRPPASAPRRAASCGLARADAAAVAELAELLAGAAAPGARRRRGRRRPRDAGRRSSRWPSGSRCPVWQESFSARAGLPAGSPAVRRPPAGRPHAPARDARAARPRARRRRAGVPPVPVHPGPFVEAGHARRDGQRRPGRGAPQPRRPRAARAARRRSAPSSRGACRRATARRPPIARPPAPPAPPAAGEPLRAGHVFAAIAERIPRNAIVIEESPSNRPELLARLPARESLGSLSPAMGGLGFALPAAIGLRMARPDRPVVAIVGDGSSLYSIQALWSAAQYGAGALFVILSNGGYAIMDRLAEQQRRHGPWPGFDDRRRRPRAGARLPGAHGARARRAAADARRGAPGPRRPRASRCCSRSRSLPTRRSRRDARRERASRLAAARCERAGRVRDPALPLDARPAAGRAARHRAGARGRVRRQPADAARGAAAARELAPDPRLAGPGRRHLRREHAERGHAPQRQRVDRGDARDRRRLADRAASRRASRSRCRSPASRPSTRPTTTAAELLAAIAEAEGNDPASEAFRIADTRFHRVIASAARNELLRAFTSWTLDVLQPSLIDTIGALDRRRRDPATSTARSSARSGCASPRPRSARCGAISSICASSSARSTAHEPEGRTVKAALMREYHQPLEFVERPVPEPAARRPTCSSGSAAPASAPPTCTRSRA